MLEYIFFVTQRRHLRKKTLLVFSQNIFLGNARHLTSLINVNCQLPSFFECYKAIPVERNNMAVVAKCHYHSSEENGVITIKWEVRGWEVKVKDLKIYIPVNRTTANVIQVTIRVEVMVDGTDWVKCKKNKTKKNKWMQ